MNFDQNTPWSSQWSGDVDDFYINEKGELQLYTSQAGESYIFTRFKVPEDSIQADLYFRMEFSPSDANRTFIYLFKDTTDTDIANGYFILLGENGSHDAVQVWKLKKGQPFLLGAGSLGAIAQNPAKARLRFRIYRDGLRLMSSDYSGGILFEDDLEFFDEDFKFGDSMYLAIRCQYTASRADLFYFDDISIKALERDTTPPVVVSSRVLDSERIKVIFSEVPEENSVMNPSHYSLNRGIGSPEKVIYSRLQPLEAILIFSSEVIESGISYRLSVSGLADPLKNSREHHMDIFYLSPPFPGDFKINEILTDPLAGGEDFIELVNVSRKFIRLDSLYIRNTYNNQTRMVSSDQVLGPGEYIVLSKNISFLREHYETPDSVRMSEVILPAMNVGSANVTLLVLRDGQEIVIDSLDYHQVWHYPLLRSTKGVSLERINYYGQTMDRHNWHSASESVRFATPGYKNSQTLRSNHTQEDMVIMKPHKKMLTPDQDGTEDFLLLEYILDKPGYLATIQLFDAEGFPMAYIARNTLLGQSGAVKWDGTATQQVLMPMGLYIIFTRLFHPDGQILESSHVVIVGQQF